MNRKSLNVLEYDKIIRLLTDYAASTMGKKQCTELMPSTEPKEIATAQQETSEAVSISVKKGMGLPLGGISDIHATLQRADMGGVLSIDELMHIGDFIHVCKKVNAYGTKDKESEAYPILDEQFAALLTVSGPDSGCLPMEREINRCIVNQYEIADDASDKLYDIRKSIRVSNDRIKEHLNSIIHSQNYKNMLQENVITIRNERYCVPIKAEYRNNFPGMVHDTSSTGATVFIEPMSVVQLNNKIKELHSDERNEIEQILRRLSALVAGQAENMNIALKILTYLDFVFAKAQLSLSMKASEPVFNARGYINIKKGRHPLLNKDTVVPTDIWLGDKFTTLLITGPNTGGKTVSLKTLGLFTLMGQAGLHIPAFDRSELAVFDDVFADIGDEQSIEQSLSTFSSHMKNIVSILDQVTDRSLVLLDELGAGTDPTEGAALAVAILDYLFDRSIRTAVTTHYSELKVYALSKEGVENASCEFNVETLAPTYRLLIGIPGKSNAFAISKRLGLQDHIIDAAKQVLSHESVHFEDIITDLEISRKSIEIEQERAESYRREAEKLKADAEGQKQKLADTRNKLIAEAKEEARRLMQAAKDDADRMLKEFTRSMRENTKDMDGVRNEMRKRISDLDVELSDIGQKKLALKAISKELASGDSVFVKSLSQSGTVVTPPNKSGDTIVQVGAMKITVPLADLFEENASKKPDKAGSKSGASFRSVPTLSKSASIKTEIDLRGYTVLDGVEAADKYIDDAYLSHLSRCTIIHGKGTGALRSAIQDLCKRHPHVKSYRYGAFGEGENGVTIVEFGE